MSLMHATGIHISYGDTKILDAVDIEINAGEIVGLIGPNGAGKSTLIKVLAHINEPDKGVLSFKGETTSLKNGRELARHIAYIPQGQVVHWPLTVERVVSLGRIPHLMPWQKMNETDYAIVEQAMRSVDIEHLRNRVVDQLAGGEKALVILARALAGEPELLLADEPVAGLDPNHQMQVMELLKDLSGKQSVLVVMHDLTLAARYCDRIYFLNQGKIIASGSPEEVLSEHHLKQGYGIEALSGKQDNKFYVIPWKRI